MAQVDHTKAQVYAAGLAQAAANLAVAIAHHEHRGHLSAAWSEAVTDELAHVRETLATVEAALGALADPSMNEAA